MHQYSFLSIVFFLFIPINFHHSLSKAGRKYGVRVNTISAGPLASRAAKAIGGAGKTKTFIDYAIDYSKANAPMAQVKPLMIYVYI
jgi:enoyl-[acyl-carrier-protein] reductase (NADH)